MTMPDPVPSRGVPAADNLRSMVPHLAVPAALKVAAAADLLDAIDALHQPERVEHYEYDGDNGTVRGVVVWCTCGQIDCPTARLLHPEG